MFLSANISHPGAIPCGQGTEGYRIFTAARGGDLEAVQALLAKDPALAHRTDRVRSVYSSTRLPARKPAVPRSSAAAMSVAGAPGTPWLLL